MPYLMGGFPDQGTATAVARAYADAGADQSSAGFRSRTPLRTDRQFTPPIPGR